MADVEMREADEGDSYNGNQQCGLCGLIFESEDR